ncbi:pectate lyase-like adhesive domain-containing protein [Lactobacillus sp. Sy-1]|uniref:pectate lyase-like adhesive domain-containing protein n=1 Tax=Lactobacillus sp. Sy-1 TaxID=2109645 RepID=UPI001C5B64BF|nr:pectate lyase-like adhesive domain-containing protein [Lactobacillus sp. Sy-1]MBW1606261.1 hypothetical protein [Lactobacillus sp. Sy-1]
MFNQKDNEKKKLRKVKKSWVVFSTAVVFATALGYQLTTPSVVNAAVYASYENTSVSSYQELIKALMNPAIKVVNLNRSVDLTGVNINQLVLDASSISTRSNRILIPGRDLNIHLNGNQLNFGSIQISISSLLPMNLVFNNGQLSGTSINGVFNLEQVKESSLTIKLLNTEFSGSEVINQEYNPTTTVEFKTVAQTDSGSNSTANNVSESSANVEISTPSSEVLPTSSAASNIAEASSSVSSEGSSPESNAASASSTAPSSAEASTVVSSEGSSPENNAASASSTAPSSAEASSSVSSEESSSESNTASASSTALSSAEASSVSSEESSPENNAASASSTAPSSAEASSAVSSSGTPANSAESTTTSLSNSSGSASVSSESTSTTSNGSAVSNSIHNQTATTSSNANILAPTPNIFGAPSLAATYYPSIRQRYPEIEGKTSTAVSSQSINPAVSVVGSDTTTISQSQSATSEAGSQSVFSSSSNPLNRKSNNDLKKSGSKATDSSKGSIKKKAPGTSESQQQTKRTKYIKIKKLKNVKLYRKASLNKATLNPKAKLKLNQKYRVLKQLKNQNGKAVYQISSGYLVSRAKNLLIIR